MAAKSNRLTVVAAADDPILTPEQVSKLIQIPVVTLRTWRCRGKGPKGFKVGSLVRYRQSEVHRWLAACGDTTVTEVR